MSNGQPGFEPSTPHTTPSRLHLLPRRGTDAQSDDPDQGSCSQLTLMSGLQLAKRHSQELEPPDVAGRFNCCI